MWQDPEIQAYVLQLSLRGLSPQQITEYVPAASSKEIAAFLFEDFKKHKAIDNRHTVPLDDLINNLIVTAPPVSDINHIREKPAYFIQDGILFFRIGSLSYPKEISTRAVWRALKRRGGVPHVAKLHGKPTRYWSLPWPEVSK